MLSLAWHHLLFLIFLLLVVEMNEGQLPIEIIFLFKQSVHLPHEQFFTESFAVSLELSNFIELVLEVDLTLAYFCILWFILMHKLVNWFLQFTQLDVGKIIVSE